MLEVRAGLDDVTAVEPKPPAHQVVVGGPHVEEAPHRVDLPRRHRRRVRNDPLDMLVHALRLRMPTVVRLRRLVGRLGVALAAVLEDSHGAEEYLVSPPLPESVGHSPTTSNSC